MSSRRLWVLLFLLVSGAAFAQTADQLPAGVIRQGNVIMMAPVDGTDSGSTISGEHRASAAKILSAGDHDLYSRAMSLGDRGDWTGARGLAASGHDAMARRIIEWRYLLDQNSGAPFAQIDAFLKANRNWPNRGTLFVRAEEAMDPTMTPAAVVAWFGERTPSTGIGMVRLGEALIATGSATRGRELIQRGWTDFSFQPQQELAVAQAHADILTPDIDRKRIDHLLWRDDIGSAERELSRVEGEARDAAKARIQLRRNLTLGRKMVSELSVYGQRESGVEFDLARADRKASQYDEAGVLLQRVDRSVAANYPKAWWNELNIIAREGIKSANYRTAYALVNDTGLTTGSEFADAEFLAGWLALRKLNTPRAALAHFQKLETGVSRPISRARAHYWEGRSYEALGEDTSAYQQYRLAAQDSDTFYGQIALARIDATPTLHLKDTPVDTASGKADFEAEDLTRALRVLADLGAVNLVRLFASYDADLSPEPRHTALLAQTLVDLGYRDVALRVAKTASYNGLPMLKYAYPVIAVPPYPGPYQAPEPPIVLALIRQETEFDPTSVSGPGAMGLMQMMPSSARDAAREAHLPYRPDALISDTTYNMQLGETEFSAHLSQWGGSYVLASAAYNAGDANARKWLNDYGDPRSPNVDPIDWIEVIPFSETRNYVQRILENVQVYRNRVAGGDQPLRMLNDLYRPNTLNVRVIAPPAPAAAPSPAAPDPKPRKHHHD